MWWQPSPSGYRLVQSWNFWFSSTALRMSYFNRRFGFWTYRWYGTHGQRKKFVLVLPVNNEHVLKVASQPLFQSLRKTFFSGAFLVFRGCNCIRINGLSNIALSTSCGSKFNQFYLTFTGASLGALRLFCGNLTAWGSVLRVKKKFPVSSSH